MAKPSKSSSREFLLQRRKAIAEMAKKRRQQELVRGPGISVADSGPKTTTISLRGTTPPPSQN